MTCHALAETPPLGNFLCPMESQRPDLAALHSQTQMSLLYLSLSKQPRRTASTAMASGLALLTRQKLLPLLPLLQWLLQLQRGRQKILQTDRQSLQGATAAAAAVTRHLVAKRQSQLSPEGRNWHRMPRLTSSTAASTAQPHHLSLQSDLLQSQPAFLALTYTQPEPSLLRQL